MFCPALEPLLEYNRFSNTYYIYEKLVSLFDERLSQNRKSLPDRTGREIHLKGDDHMLRVLTPDEVIRYGLDKVNWIKVEPSTQSDYNPTDMELAVSTLMCDT